MGYYSNLSIELEKRGREDHSLVPRTFILRCYMEDISSALAERGVSVESLREQYGSLDGWQRMEPRYYYFEVLQAERPSIEELLDALRPITMQESIEDNTVWEQLLLTA